MKNGPLLLLLLLLAGALWLLVGSDGADAPSEGGRTWLDAPSPETGPALGVHGEAAPLPAGAPPPAPAPAAQDAGTLALEGRVVDEARRPVAGAQVELRAGGRLLAAAASDAQGRYAMAPADADLSGGRRVLLRALTTDGRAGTATSWLGPPGAVQALPTVVVERACELALRVVRDGGGVLGARVVVVRREGGSPVPVAALDADAAGRARVRGLAPGVVEVFATAPGHGRGLTKVSLPRPEGAPEVEVALQGERRLVVRVVDEGSGRPVGGATVRLGDARTMPEPHGPGYLPPLPPLVTDRDGRVEVRRLGVDETLYLNVQAAGFAAAPWWASKDQVVRPGQEEARVALVRARTVRFPVGPGDVPAPADGTPLRVEVRGSARGEDLGARMERGDAVLEGLGRGARAGTLVAPDGAQAAFEAPAQGEHGPLLVFHAPREVRVHVAEPGGRPVAGLGLRLVPVGRAPAVPPAVTDAGGLATFTGVGGDAATLHRSVSDQPWGGELLAQLDLTAGIAVHEIVIQPAVALRLALRIEGEPRLPAEYALVAAGQRVDPATIHEAPDAGELRCALRPPASDGPLHLELRAAGYLPSSFEIDVGAAGPVERTLDLEPAGRLVVQVTPPADGEYDLRLERDAGADGWQPAAVPAPGRPGPLGGPQAIPPAEGGRHVFEGLVPGRYRVLDVRSRAASEAGQVRSGGEGPELTLDLAGAVWVEGRVTVPPGQSATLARVLVEGRDDPSNVAGGTRVDGAGRFRLRALRGSRLTLRAVHPTLFAADAGGRVSVEAGAPGPVELRLESGPELRFAVAGYESAHTPEGGLWSSPLQVHLLPEEAGRGEPRSLTPVAVRGTFHVGGFAPARYTLWLVFGDAQAPYVQHGLELGTEAVDLGVLRPPGGAAVRVHVAGWAERPQAAVWASATYEGAPEYVRHARLDRAAGELTVVGLGAGRFRVVVRASGVSPGAPGIRVLLDRVVTVPEGGEAALDVSLD